MIDIIYLVKFILSAISFLSSFVSIFNKIYFISKKEPINSFLSNYGIDNSVNIIKTKINENILVYKLNEKEKEIRTAFILYSGAYINYTEYEPLMESCAKKGIMSIAIKMPFNFALFNLDLAEEVKNKFPEIENWYIGGIHLEGWRLGCMLVNI